MKKELKDYLHLYLGCDCRLDNKETGKLIGFDSRLHDAELEMVCYTIWLDKENDWSVYNDDKNFGRIKPILRPLSDMTEEAIKLFQMLSLYDLKDCVFDFIEDESSFCINAELRGRVIDAMEVRISDFPIINMMNKDGSFSPVSNIQDIFMFLISKHFDLFGLIESGLAIDKTTLK